MKLLEKDMENLIIDNPLKYLKEPDLKLVSRQYSIGNYRFDLLFEDRHHGKLIVEIQRGTLDRNHTYKILDYFDEYKKRNPNNFIDLMIVANKITRERRDRLKSYGISFFEIPKSIFLEDPNWIKKKHNNEQIDTVEKGIGEPNNSFSGDCHKGKENFKRLIQRKYWLEECAKLTELTSNRKNQLIKIFTEMKDTKIPFSYFSSEQINNQNSQIYPIICAYHIGYFSVDNDSIFLNKQFIEKFELDYSKMAPHKTNSSMNKQQDIISTDVYTIIEKVTSVFKNKRNETYRRNEIIDMVIEVYPDTNRTSVIPSDYCYNLTNRGIPFKTHLFESLGSGNYKCLGENFPYEGEIYWKNEKVGDWYKGKPVLKVDPRK